MWLLVPAVYCVGRAAEKAHYALKDLFGHQGSGWPNAVRDSRQMLVVKRLAARTERRLASRVEQVCRVDHPECWTSEMYADRPG